MKQNTTMPVANTGDIPTHGPTAAGTFDELMPALRRAVAAEGYNAPTPIQEKCIPHLLQGRDLIGCAQTGTGKTAAFALPLLQRLTETPPRSQTGRPRALLVAPTRELAAQIDDSIRTYGRFLKLRHTVIFGGVNQNPQVRALKRGVDILTGTPGRMLDLMNQGFIHLDEIEIFVLDEVDRMLDMGFIPDVKRILAQVPDKRQTVFFSATMPPKMAKLARSMATEPVEISITPNQPTVTQVNQKVLFVGKSDKHNLLLSLLDRKAVAKALIFTQMKHTANRVVQKLSKAGIRGAAIHGNKSQAARTKALDGFRHGRYRVLVATDVAARGLDVDDISHVINYDLPIEAETYVHRIGRTARAGAEGDAISFCSKEDGNYLQDIDRMLGEPVPTETEHDYHCEEACLSRSRRSSGRNSHHRKPNGNGRSRRPSGGQSRGRRYAGQKNRSR